MATLIAATMPDGGVVLTPLKTRFRRQEDSDGYAERVLDSAARGAVRVRLVHEDKLPPSRKHREAWVDDGTRIVVDPSRIRAPAVEESPAPPDRVIAVDTDAILSAARDDAMALVTQMRNDVLRYVVELQIALNAAKSDEEVNADPKGKMALVREQSRALLSELAADGDWAALARKIISGHDADAVALMRGSAA